MALSILNNIAALYAQNNINNTQTKLSSTLNQLSSGSKLNSGADDPSALAVADGLSANQAALTQSATNATEGIGMLQTADGALSQVSTLLNQAITIATEIGGGTLTTNQISSANQEYTNILNQITNIGSHTNYNSSSVFSATAVSINVGDGTTAGSSVYSDTVGTLTTSNIGSSAAAGVASNVTSNTPAAGAALTLSVGAASSTVGGTLTINGGSSTYNLTVAAGTTIAQLGGLLSNDAAFAAAGLSITGQDSTSISITPTNVANQLTDGSPATFKQTPTGATIGNGTDLATTYSTINTGNATAAAQAITNAIGTVAYQRGTIGADINQLTSAASVASTEQVNLASAQNSVTATDYGQAASNLSKYQILSQTGISALAQANSVQQEVLKLLQ